MSSSAGSLLLGRRSSFCQIPNEKTPLSEGWAADLPPEVDSPTRRRFTFQDGESQYPSRLSTWIMEDSEGTLDDKGMLVCIVADLTPAGILPLSFEMSRTGYLTAISVMFFFAGLATYMMYLIGRTMELTGKKSVDQQWADVVNSGTAWFPSFVILAVCVGYCVAYACMFGDLFAMCMPSLGLGFVSRTLCLGVLTIFPLLPLCYLRDLSGLVPTSFGALIAVAFTLAMMLIRLRDGSYSEGGAYFEESRVSDGDHLVEAGPGSLILVSGLAMGFMCHHNGCKYYREFANRRPDRFGITVLTSYAIASTVLAVAMTVGYATFGDNSNPVVLVNYSSDDPLANVARVGVGLATVFSFPIMFTGLREQACTLIVMGLPDMKETSQQVWFLNTLSTVALAVVSLVAVVITNSSTVVGLVGSTCGSATIYVLPTILFDRACAKYISTDKYTCAEKLLVRCIGFSGFFLMVTGTIVTLCF